jgi:hypothetical protein
MPDGSAANTERARIGRNNRRRGSDGEREVCALLRDAFGLDVRRRLGQERDRGHDVTLPAFDWARLAREEIAAGSPQTQLVDGALAARDAA